MAHARRQRNNTQRPAEARRRWLRLAGWALIVVLLAASLSALVAKLRDPHTLPVRQVRIEGDFVHMDRRELEAVAAPLVSGGFFTIDLRRVEAAVEALPWVYDVALRRHWPDTLELRVTEQVAIARWGEAALLNQYGELFAPAPASFPQGLPVLHGPEGKERELIDRFIAVSDLLGTAGLKPRALIEDERRAWHLILDRDVKITMGRDDTLARLKRFLAVYPQALGQKVDALARIDLRYTNGFAVAWRAPDAPAAP